MQGHHRGGAAGVHGDGGALEAVRVGETARGDAGGVAGHQVSGELFLGGGTAEPDLVVGGDASDEDAGGAVAQGPRVDAGPFEGLPGGLQQQPLLRVHRQRLARGDPEERGVESGDVPDEAALAAVRGALPVGVRVVEGVQVPAAVLGRGGHDVQLGRHQLPQFLGRGDAAGEAAGHRDDGHRLVGDARGHHDGRGGGAVLAEDQGAQVRDDRRGVRVVEEQGGGELEVGGGGDPVADLHGGQRVEAEVLEGAVDVDRFR